MRTDDQYRRQIPALLADYEALGGLPSWRPYLMFFHAPNFKSPTINTDRYGFRFGCDETGSPVAVADASDNSCGLLVGNSVAFGVGASADEASLAARLSIRSGELWHNFSGRAFGGLQEWLLFHGYRHLVGPIRHVVLLTGLNDLSLHYVPRDADPIFGVAFYGERFRQAMNELAEPRVWDASGRDLLRALRRRLGDRIRSGGRRPAPPIVDYAEAAAADVRARVPSREAVIERIERQLVVWKAMADASGFRLVYVLQPLWPWMSRSPSPIEQESVLAYDDIGPWNALIKAVVDDEHREWYVTRLSRACARIGIPFVDMNAALSDAATEADWLFLDRIHLTDRGQDLCAAVVADIVSGLD